MNNIQVSIRSLVKTYASGHETLRVLDDLNLDISSSSSTAICGKSGCGKSTLLNIIGGLDRPTSGSVKIDDWHLEDLSPARLNSFRSQYIGFVFQFHYLLKDFTALENIMLPAHIAGLSKKAAFEKAEKLIDEVKLSSRARHFPSQLSGGERQRIALARSLINSPKLILADEPTGNLDPANSQLVADILFELCEKHKKSLVIVTHDSSIAERASRILHLEAGRFSQEATEVL